ncbi:MAG TPA: hypothetical protein VLG50_07840 [Candidatus Saccharimonadales bacterium]|nr:hypothetical protein [Candidatus Saccharimonadales bacterium]
MYRHLLLNHLRSSPYYECDYDIQNRNDIIHICKQQLYRSQHGEHCKAFINILHLLGVRGECHHEQYGRDDSKNALISIIIKHLSDIIKDNEQSDNKQPEKQVEKQVDTKIDKQVPLDKTEKDKDNHNLFNIKLEKPEDLEKFVSQTINLISPQNEQLHQLTNSLMKIFLSPQSSQSSQTENKTTTSDKTQQILEEVLNQQEL